MSTIAEAEVEQAAITWLKELGWSAIYGPDMVPDTDGSERADYGQVVLEQRLRDALEQFNPDLPSEGP